MYKIAVSRCLQGLLILSMAAAGLSAAAPAAPPSGFRGVYFNPQVKPGEPDFPWLCFYRDYRPQVRAALQQLSSEGGINLVDIFVCIAHSLKTPSQAPRAGQPVAAWGNLSYLDGVAAFVDDCHASGIQVELDLANNMWVPYSVDPGHQIANSGHWPMPDESPWDEAATWYGEVIRYIEARAKHPENIAFWCMMGNYELGTAEPCLWEREDQPAILSSTEQFVKEVWPLFRSAGKRPKAPPIMLPIFARNAYWEGKSSGARLSAFSNLKRWVVDELRLPPDYWVMTAYPFCDPAPDGISYLREVVSILGPENANRLIATDLKGPGHDDVRDCILSFEGQPEIERLHWHFRKCAEYRLAGWWIWAYQDTLSARSGLCRLSGEWKGDLLKVLQTQAAGKGAAPSGR